MYVSSCAFIIVEYIRTSKSCTFFIFAEAEERGCVYFSLSACFSMIQYSREKSSINIFSSQLKVTVINVATQLKLRFGVMLVLRNLIFENGLLNRIQNVYFHNTRVYNLSYGSPITHLFGSCC